PVAASQRRTESPEAVTSSTRPSVARPTCKATMGCCPIRAGGNSRREVTSQRRTAPPPVPENRERPSGAKARAVTGLSWGRRVAPKRARAPGGSGSPYRSVRAGRGLPSAASTRPDDETAQARAREVTTVREAKRRAGTIDSPGQLRKGGD